MAVTPDMIAHWRRQEQPIRDGYYCVDAKDIWPGDVLLGWEHHVTRLNPEGLFYREFTVDRVVMDGRRVKIYGRSMDPETGELDDHESFFDADYNTKILVETDID